jgi:pimeloyl-ACP methyl ester carboxylesterase
VIAVDRPGFGYSDRPRGTVWSPEAQAQAIQKALQKIGLEQPIVVGHSWGTLVALAMALNDPDAIAGLVLLSGYYYGTARPDVVGPSLMALPVVGDVLANTIAPFVGLATGPIAVKASFAPAGVPEKFSGFPVALGLRPAQMRATAADTALMIPGAVALSARYGELELPAIIMAGEGDLIVHVQNHAARLVEELKQAELRVVPAQGHMFHYAVPDQVVAAIDRVDSVALSQRLHPSPETAP